ncbi:N-acetylmuramoyl-L-alanine amidase [Kitasatospora sp. NPDC059571]|uniref:N-acetylmuramoyl-L-alanine amidase n=1 Tax=Kitasatospora sp. NPDC059571 TaxID=3346871 RepID=UPI0036747DEE
MTDTHRAGHGSTGAAHRRTHKLRIPLAITAAVAASATGFALLAGANTTPASAVGSDQLQREFAAAAGEFHVPESVLLALSYQQSRWESHHGEPSTTGNYSVMGLTQVDPAAVAKAIDAGPGPEVDGRGDDAPVRKDAPPVQVEDSPALHTLDQAAKLIDKPADKLKSDPAQSIRGAAALLVEYQKAAGKPLSGDPAAWYSAVSRFSQSPADSGGNDFADRVLGTVQVGASRTTTDGQLVTLAAAPAVKAGDRAALRLSSADGQTPVPLGAPVITVKRPAGSGRTGRTGTKSGKPTGSTTTGSTTGRSTTGTTGTAGTGTTGSTGASSHTATGTRTAVQAAFTTAPAVGSLLADEPHPVECPTSLSCDFKPAAYALTDTSDPTSYGNYTIADRPSDGDKIEYIVIHDTEGGFDGSIATFQKPATQASAHYIIRSSDGHVTQLVNTKNMAWHAGNKTVNMHSIGIEHEGYAFPSNNATWYSEQLYQSSAALTRYLADRFGVPLDRQHIIGHDDVPGPRQSDIAGMHWDPGTFWDWNHYMDLIGAPVRASTGGPILVGGKVTIAPAFDSTNTPPVDNTAARPENFVYLRTAPNAGAALINGGTTQAANWKAKAVAGTSYVVADQQGDWTAIWYDSVKAWFYNPNGQSAAADNRAGQTVLVPKAGQTSIPVYGRSYPELTAYAPYPAIDTTNLTPAPYTATVPAGQGYLPGSDQALAGDFYYAQNINGDAPNDRTLVVGTDTYYPIRYNHRLAFLKSTDVDLVTATTPAPSGYAPVTPKRLLDTRSGLGAAKAKVGTDSSITLPVTGGAGGVPANATAVILNVTAVNPTAAGFVTVYPDGQPRPASSNLNFTAGQTIPNLVVVPVVNGSVRLYNRAGTVDLLADITGYYAPDAAAALATVTPNRLLDTRIGLGAPQAKVNPDSTLTLTLDGVPANATGVVLNVTAVNPTAAGFVTVYPHGSDLPVVSNLNFTAGQTIPNQVIVPVSDGKVNLYNRAGTVDLLADITGYYAPDATSKFIGTGPSRLLDTRTGVGTPTGKAARLHGDSSMDLTVAGRAGLPLNGVTAVVLNVTAVQPTSSGFVTVYPAGTTRPVVSNLNFTAGQVIPNLVVVPVKDGKVSLYNRAGDIDLVADITGYYTG